MTVSGLFLIDVRPAGRIKAEDALKSAAAAEAALSAGRRYGLSDSFGQSQSEA